MLRFHQKHQFSDDDKDVIPDFLFTCFIAKGQNSSAKGNDNHVVLRFVFNLNLDLIKRPIYLNPKNLRNYFTRKSKLKGPPECLKHI